MHDIANNSPRWPATNANVGGLERLSPSVDWTAAILILVLALVPMAASAIGEPYYVTLMTRALIFALAAVGLNLILGYGGLVSFGHSVYLGIGVYTVGIMMDHGITNAWLQLAAALLIGTIVAGVIGALSLRVKGVGFIMITLAFAQLLYFFCVGLRDYGGDDGFSLSGYSDFGLFQLDGNNTLYYVVLAVLAFTLLWISRLISARFGMVIQGCKSNERRMVALGFPVFRYQWVAYVLSALICVVAGFFIVNLTRYVSPAYMQWTVSGELIVMVVVGGIATIVGPVIGAIAIVLFEEFASHAAFGLPGNADAFIHEHWLGALGLVILIVALCLKQGLYGSLFKRSARRA